jgi:putative endonuclease
MRVRARVAGGFDMTDRILTGERWEEIAARHLERAGLTVLARRYRCRLGELDLICRDGPVLVIVEVRARGGRAYAHATESIDQHKRVRIIRTTRHFLMCHPEWQQYTIRFDVVAIDRIDSERPALAWIRGAFDAG